MNAALLSVSEVMTSAGFRPVDVPVLLPMEDFVRISGEEFRRHIFVTSDNGGSEYCLRPEFTIPVCRMVLSDEPRGGRFSYSGRVFRNGQPGEPGEVWQVGGEIIGDHDPVEADVEALDLALSVSRALGLAEPDVMIGDVKLFTSLLDSLDVPPAWKRRLTTLFGETERVSETLDAMVERRDGFAQFAAHRDVVTALGVFPTERVGELFADILAIAGIQTVGGRSTAEIAERVLEQATLAGSVVKEADVKVIRDLLAIEAPLDMAVGDLDALSLSLGRPAAFEAAVRGFEARAEAIASGAQTIPVFSAKFDRKLGYYDGFVFDVFDGLRPQAGQVCGGGRYDGLLAGFGAAPEIRAVGFAVWTERFEEIRR